MASLALTRPRPPRAMISLVPMIDVLLIMLVFFMVTSTYLDLDMVPAVESSDEAPSESVGAMGSTLLIRIGSDGRASLQGQTLGPQQLETELAARLVADPATSVVILPSGGADMQALVNVMDAATRAGAARLRVIRLEARP